MGGKMKTKWKYTLPQCKQCGISLSKSILKLKDPVCDSCTNKDLEKLEL